MKKQYESPVTEIVEFETEDIITNSGNMLPTDPASQMLE